MQLTWLSGLIERMIVAASNNVKGYKIKGGMKKNDFEQQRSSELGSASDRPVMSIGKYAPSRFSQIITYNFRSYKCHFRIVSKNFKMIAHTNTVDVYVCVNSSSKYA